MHINASSGMFETPLLLRKLEATRSLISYPKVASDNVVPNLKSFRLNFYVKPCRMYLENTWGIVPNFQATNSFH